MDHFTLTEKESCFAERTVDEEHAGVGAAMSNEQHRKDMESIKEMGANFVRLAHYPQDPEIYKACDELGLLVWDELPWCRGGMGNEVWQTNTKNLLSEMIHQNYNHPSIIIWSLGNEMSIGCLISKMGTIPKE